MIFLKFLLSLYHMPPGHPFSASLSPGRHLAKESRRSLCDWVTFDSKTKFHEPPGRSEKEVMRKEGLWTAAECLGSGEGGGGSVGAGSRQRPRCELGSTPEEQHAPHRVAGWGQLSQHGSPGLRDFTVATAGRVPALECARPQCDVVISVHRELSLGGSLYCSHLISLALYMPTESKQFWCEQFMGTIPPPQNLLTCKFLLTRKKWLLKLKLP